MRCITKIALETIEEARLSLRDFTKSDPYGTLQKCVENASPRAIEAILFKVSRLRPHEKRLATPHVDAPATRYILPQIPDEELIPEQLQDNATAVAIATEIYSLCCR